MADSTAALSFGTVAETYDKMRPGYPDAAFDRLAETAQLDSSSAVLEIGAGTGQATLSLLARGLSIICLEPSAKLAEILARNVAIIDAGRAEVVISDLQGYSVEPNSLDLLFGATALHWIPGNCLQSQADTGLRPTGWVASLTNRHTTGASDQFFAQAQDVYQRYAPELARGFRLPTVAEASHPEPVMAGLEGYRPAQMWSFLWQESYSATDYIQILGTYSTHITLPAKARDALFGAIKDLAERRYGGTIVKDYVTVLTLRQRCKSSE